MSLLSFKLSCGDESKLGNHWTGVGRTGGQACITNVSRGFIEQSKKELHSIPRSFFAPKLYGNFHPRNVRKVWWIILKMVAFLRWFKFESFGASTESFVSPNWSPINFFTKHSSKHKKIIETVDKCLKANLKRLRSWRFDGWRIESYKYIAQGKLIFMASDRSTGGPLYQRRTGQGSSPVKAFPSLLK